MSKEAWDLLQRYAELFNAGKVDALDEVMAADVVDHNPLPDQAPGLEGVKEAFAMFRSALPDMAFEMKDVIAEGDRIAFRSVVRGTHKGEFMGMSPTGKTFEVDSIDIVRLEGGKMAEHWGVFDQTAMMMQLGLAPAPVS